MCLSIPSVLMGGITIPLVNSKFNLDFLLHRVLLWTTFWLANLVAQFNVYWAGPEEYMSREKCDYVPERSLSLNTRGSISLTRFVDRSGGNTWDSEARTESICR